MDANSSSSGQSGQNEHSMTTNDTEQHQSFRWLRSFQPVSLADIPHAPIPLVYSSTNRDNDGPDGDGIPQSRLFFQHHPAYSTSSNDYNSHFDASTNASTYGTFPLAPQTVIEHNDYGESFHQNGHTTLPLLDDYDSAYMSEDIYGTDTAAEGDDIDTSGPIRKRKRSRGRDIDQPRKRRTGQRGGWSKGLTVGPRKVLEPTEHFTSLYDAALKALVDEQNTNKALELILQAININPEIFAAHSLLAEIYFSKGEPIRALDVLMTGAHANPNDVETWRKVADMVLSNPDQDHTDKISRALYCFSAILRKDGKDHDARFQRAQCYKELCNYTKALTDLNVIFQDDSHNSSVLAAITGILVEIGDVTRAINVYDEHFDFYRQTVLSEENRFEWRDIATYSDLIAKAGDTVLASIMLKKLSRWLVGRESEHFWDKYEEDDREWDQDHEPRRVVVPEFRNSRFSNDTYGDSLPLDLRSKLGIYRLQQNFRDEAQYHFEWLLPDLAAEDAPVQEFADTFLQVAQALQDAKEHEQALRFFAAIQRTDIDLGADFWLAMATSSYICDKKDQALELYEKVIEIEPTSVEARTQLSKLYHDQGNRAKALQYGHEALNLAQEAVPETQRRRYERKDQRVVRENAEKALRNAYQLPSAPGRPKGKVPKELRYRVRRARRFRKIPLEMLQEGLEKSSNQRPIPKARTQRRKVTKTNSKMQHFQEIQQLFQTLRNHEDAMRDGDEIARNTWIDCAQALVEDFRSQKVFYPGERHKKFEGYRQGSDQNLIHRGSEAMSQVGEGNHILPSIESQIPSDYCGIFFSTWLDIMLEYALVLANSSTLTTETQSDCYAAISAATDCTVFYHDDSAMLQIHVCYLACAMALGDAPTLFNTALRWFMKEYAFCTDTYRLFAAINLMYDYPADSGGKAGQMEKAVFRGGKNQKFMFRQIMSIDKLLPHDYNVDGSEGPVPDFMRRPRDELRKIERRVAAEAAEQKIRKANSLVQNTRVNEDDENDNEEDDIINNLDASHNDTMTKLHTPVEMDVVLFTIYAHIMMAGNSFPNALSYLYRAYSLDPTNSVVLLSMALCYMHQLFKRQNENRHMYVLQGWAWFEKYADARLTWAKSVQAEEGGDEVISGEISGELVRVIKREIEFNRARCWHMLGMADLALRGYKKMLNSAAPVKPAVSKTRSNEPNFSGVSDVEVIEKKPRLVNGVIVEEDDVDVVGGITALSSIKPTFPNDDDGLPAEDWSMEAAYAMAITYAHNGNALKAREITEKYLVVE